MVDIAQLAEHRVVAAGVEGSSPSVHPTYIGVWCNGSIPVSNTVDGGSNPSAPAKTVEKKEEESIWKKNLNIKKSTVG